MKTITTNFLKAINSEKWTTCKAITKIIQTCISWEPNKTITNGPNGTVSKRCREYKNMNPSLNLEENEAEFL